MPCRTCINILMKSILIVIKFSTNNEDCFDIKYSNTFSLKKLDGIINKYNCVKEFEDSSDFEFIRRELTDEITKKMLEANDYHYLPFSMDRDQIEFNAQEYEEIPF